MTLYVENLPESATPPEVTALFAPFGRVLSANIPVNRSTGKGYGAAFVEMDHGGENAILALDEASYHGRTLSVVEALPLAPV